MLLRVDQFRLTFVKSKTLQTLVGTVTLLENRHVLLKNVVDYTELSIKVFKLFPESVQTNKKINLL